MSDVNHNIEICKKKKAHYTVRPRISCNTLNVTSFNDYGHLLSPESFLVSQCL